MAETTHRAREALLAVARDYPGIWDAVNTFRAAKGRLDMEWPDWCFLPLAAAYAVVSGGGGNRVAPGRAADVARVGALMAWRMTQGIYRFDPAVYSAVAATPVAGDIPAEAIMQLPEWCVYVETPDMQIGSQPMHGFWAHLEHDMGTGGAELRLLLDTDDALLPLPLHLGAWPLAESVARATDRAHVHAVSLGLPMDARGVREQAQAWAGPLVSLLLYLCSAADFSRRGNPAQPSNPPMQQTKRGPRIFPASGPTTWDVGVRMGSALRAAYAAEQIGAHQGGSVRGHIRRAHWHGFRSGPMKTPDGQAIPAEKRRFELRWMPPIAVNLPDIEQLPATIYPVK